LAEIRLALSCQAVSNLGWGCFCSFYPSRQKPYFYSYFNNHTLPTPHLHQKGLLRTIGVWVRWPRNSLFKFSQNTKFQRNYLEFNENFAKQEIDNFANFSLKCENENVRVGHISKKHGSEHCNVCYDNHKK